MKMTRRSFLQVATASSLLPFVPPGCKEEYQRIIESIPEQPQNSGGLTRDELRLQKAFRGV